MGDNEYIAVLDPGYRYQTVVRGNSKRIRSTDFSWDKPSALRGSIFLKNEILLFDKILVHQSPGPPASLFDSDGSDVLGSLDHELSRLRDLRILEDIELQLEFIMAAEPGTERWVIEHALRKACSPVDEGEFTFTDDWKVGAFQSWLTATDMRKEGLNAVATEDILLDQEVKKLFSQPTDALAVTFSAFPSISDEVPMDEVIGIRNDREFWDRRTALRSWMRKMDEFDRIHIRDELEYAIHQYNEYMRVQKIKCDVGICQSVVYMLASTIENLMKLKFTDLADSLFSIDSKQIDLAEAELSAPGREVSFIAKLRDRFG